MSNVRGTLSDWAEVLREREDARKFASDQLATWARVAMRVGEKDRVLAISHGGIIELPAITLGQRLRVPLEGASFGYCEGVVITYAKNVPGRIEIVRWLARREWPARPPPPTKTRSVTSGSGCSRRSTDLGHLSK